MLIIYYLHVIQETHTIKYFWLILRDHNNYIYYMHIHRDIASLLTTLTI